MWLKNKEDKLRKKYGLFILIFMVTCFVLLMEAKEKAVDVKIILDQKITMRDGVKLSARIWMPEEIKKPLPTIFVFTPYISDESQNEPSQYFLSVQDILSVFHHKFDI